MFRRRSTCCSKGVIDSFGVVEIIMMLEQRFGIEFDFDELPADDLTRIGPLSAYVERKSAYREMDLAGARNRRCS